MRNQIREAFEQFHAEEGLKAKTKSFLLSQTEKAGRSRFHRLPRLMPALLCLFLILLGGGGCWLYFSPTASIRVEINPSLELAVNRFDKIVSVRGTNEDGRQLADTLKVSFTDYQEAVLQVLQSEPVAELLKQDEWLTIAVSGENDSQCDRILSSLEADTEDLENALCCRATEADLEAAENAGLPYGKYRVFLELQALDPSITPDTVRGMSMRKLRQLVNVLSGQDSDRLSEDGTGRNSRTEVQTEAGKGRSQRRRQKRGKA